MDDKEIARVKRRIFMRGLVKELFTFIPDIMGENRVTEEDFDLFYEVLAEEAAAEVAKVPISIRRYPIMPDEEAKLFEKETVQHGKWIGCEVGEVPASYWLFFTEGPFQKKLFRYVRSRLFEQRVLKEKA